MDSASQKLTAPAHAGPDAARSFDASPIATAGADHAGRPLWANSALCDLLDQTPEQLGLRSLGEIAAAVAQARGAAPAVQFIDERAHRSTVDALQQQLAEQAVITLLGERALAGLPLVDLIAEAVVAVTHVLDTDMGAYAELSRDRATLTVRSATGWPDGLEGSTFEVSDDLREAVCQRGDLDGVLRAAHAPVFESGGAVAGIGVLVGDPSNPLGILGASARRERAFGDSDSNFLRAVAHVLAGAIERSRAEERARHEALHDALTGLPNRALLLDRLQQGLSRHASGRGQLFVLLLDIDSLALVNDSLGHATGDDLLRETAARLTDALGPADTVARLSGDEFGILCVDADCERQADRIAEQVRAAFVRPYLLAGEPHFISASLGVAVEASDPGRSPGDLLRDADTALKRAKQRGRGGYELFDPSTRARVVNRLKVESELRHAIEADELRVEYQPYFRLADDTPAGIEALVRWQHPERGMIPPGDFIPVAEDSGLIVQLGEWVLRHACNDLARWRADHDWATGLRMTVNVSARQVHEPGLPAIVKSALEDAGLPPGLLGIEITEGLLLDQERAPQGALAALKQLGVRLLLDDFGTGYSSLSYLSRFPVDVLKVDRSFVRDLGSRTESAAIVTAIIALARGLRLDVIAEGIETEQQADHLREIGCVYGQGFLMSRPLPATQLVERLSTD